MNSNRQKPAEQAAVLPFRIIESLGIGCGYERSFKLSDRSILANRYLLGIHTGDVTRNQLTGACRQLNMPHNFQVEFLDGLPGADTILFGFEDDEQAGSIYKVYLEYWDRLRHRLLTGDSPREPYLLHKGFKWQINAPDKQTVTLYQCLPGLAVEEIRNRIFRIYRDMPQPRGIGAVIGIISAAQRQKADDRYLYMEAGESGNPRKSFDLNLYPAGLRVEQIAESIRDAAAAFGVPEDKLEKLLSIIRDKFFGHLSGGISRTGKEYVTIYYEN